MVGVPEPLLVLASGSPRRSELLGRVVAEFRVDPPDVDESPLPFEDPSGYVARLALEKARAVAARWPGAFVLGSDTTISLDGKIVGKPEGEADARRILQRLSGRTHEVLTGVALVVPPLPGGQAEEPRVLVERAEVTFQHLGPGEVDAYVAGGEPMGKAGAYAIQGDGATLVERVDGDRTAVIGLPVDRTRLLLRGACYPI
jgi:septum formation protein